MSYYDQGNRNRSRDRGAQAIVDGKRRAQTERGRDTKKPEYRPPVSGEKGQARSPTSEYQKWKDISDLALSVRQEVGIQPDTSRADNDKDSLSFIAKRALEDIQQMNKALSEEMNKLRKNIEIYSTEPTQQQQQQQQRCDKTQPPNRIRQQPQTTKQTKKEKDQPEDKKDHKSSQDDTNLEIITKAVSSFCDLQHYKGKMDHLAKRIIQLAMKEEAQPITDKTLLSQLEIAIEDIEGDLKKLRHLETKNRELKEISELAVAVGQEVGFQPDTSKADKDKDSFSFIAKRALEDIQQMNKELSEELNKLSKNMQSYSTDQTQQQQKQSIEKNQPHTRQQPQTKKTKDQSEEKKDHKSSQVDTNLEIISKAVSSIDNLQQYKRELKEISELAIAVGQEVGCMPDTSNAGKDKDSLSVNAKEALEGIKQRNKAFEAKMSQVLDFAKSMEELIGPQEGCGTLNPSSVMEVKNKKEKGRSKKGEGHDGSNADPPVGFDNGKFEQAIQLLPKVYKKMKDELNKMDHLAKRTIQLAMKEGDQPIQDKALLSQLERAIEDIEVDFKKLGQLVTKNRDEIQKLKREIEIKVTEKEALQTRLSKLAGNKMTEGNPNIANLGDPNRPTKIAEIYSEIYDNEWTDALDFCLQKLEKECREDDALQALNKTLIICYKICQEKSDEWVEKTKGVLTRCSHELMVDIQSEEFLMQIIEVRRAVSDQMSKQFLKEIRPNKDLRVAKYAKEMKSKIYKMIIQNKFFEKCFTLCWKMIVQNPRMILVEGPPRGNTYDRNVFREFTSSGSKVVFTVWPALYLHEGGPLLVKGVVKVE